MTVSIFSMRKSHITGATIVHTNSLDKQSANTLCLMRICSGFNFLIAIFTNSFDLSDD